MKSRSFKTVLLLSVAALVTVFLSWDAILELVGKRRVPISCVVDNEETTGWATVNRWEAPRPGTSAYDGYAVTFFANGLRAVEAKYEQGTFIRATYWRSDGTVSWQDDGYTATIVPPWLWGVTDQTEPTAPWWKGEK